MKEYGIQVWGLLAWYMVSATVFTTIYFLVRGVKEVLQWL